LKPALASVMAVDKPMPVDVPVINAVFTMISLF
jgi:hypothetical protein